MSILDRWHRRWLAHVAAWPDDPILAALIADKHGPRWSAAFARQYRGRDKARAPLAAWHLRWVLAEVDALVAAGRVELQEDAIVLDTAIVFPVRDRAEQ